MSRSRRNVLISLFLSSKLPPSFDLLFPFSQHTDADLYYVILHCGVSTFIIPNMANVSIPVSHIIISEENRRTSEKRSAKETYGKSIRRTRTGRKGGIEREQGRKSSEDAQSTGYARFEKVWAR